MRKLGAVTLIVLAVIFFVWLHYYKRGPQQTAITSGNNSPATIQSATQSGSNNTLIQAASGAIVVKGISDEELKQIHEGMLAIQRQKDAELRAEFNVGYILFTANERNEIVPLNSPMDDILKIDWKSGYKISFSDKTVTLRLPNMVFQTPDCNNIRFISFPVTLFKHSGSSYKFASLCNYRLMFEVVSVNEDHVVIAMGLQSPP